MTTDTFAQIHAEGIATRLAKIARYRAEAVAARDGDRRSAGFCHQLANIAQTDHDRITPALDHVAASGLGATLRHRTREQWATLFPDATEPGSFRYQLYDANGFFSHSTHATLYAAALDAAQQGYVIPDDGAATRIMSLKSFERGNRLAALIQQHNAGRLSWQDANAQADAIRAEYEPVT